MQPRDSYIPDAAYAALRKELLELAALPLVHDPDTEIVRILGETGGIWPESVLNDPARHDPKAPIIALETQVDATSIGPFFGR